jgi:hypothetical protein
LRQRKIMQPQLANSFKSLLTRNRLLAAALATLALVAAGCSHSDRKESREAAIAGLLAPEPPAFFTGPIGILLTNSAGFNARLAVEKESRSSPEARPITGELLVRGSKLLFAPGTEEPVSKRSRPGGFSFIWDVAEGRGYILSEALQVYAPVVSQLRPTNLLTQATASTRQKVDGHPCEPADATVQMSDGSASLVHVWRAVDLKGVPVRLSTATNSIPLAVGLSRIRLEAPPAILFAPPAGFAQYDSPQAMADEIALRQHNLKRTGPDWNVPLEPAEGTTGTPPRRN